jgi:hypothetical protein
LTLALTRGPNVLDRQFTADQPNRKWVAEFSYISSAESAAHCAAMLSARKRGVVALETIDEDSLGERQAAILPHHDERRRRLFTAAEAKAAGYGAIAAFSTTTRIAASTVGRGPARPRASA